MSDLTLAIETSNPTASPTGAVGAGSVCVGRLSSGVPEVLAWSALSAGTRHDDALMPAVASVCARAGVNPGDLGRVAVSIGPGGFTSLRIAVSTAKMIGEATGAACVGVPTALALASAARENGVRGRVGVLLAWKRLDVWRQRFEISESGVQAVDQAGTVVELGAAAEGCGALIGEQAVKDLLGLAGCRAPLFAPEFDARWVLSASWGLPAVDPAFLTPIYPREPEAVTKWRALGKGAGVGRGEGR